VGGVHEALTSVAPAFTRAVSVFVPVLLVAFENEATSGLDEVHVSGGVATVLPRESTAVAVMVFDPVTRLKEFSVTPCAWSRI